ncbi:MAG TPA: 5-(carboxyamino)imidazole ribonucleotide synthase [Candidatus Kapabacteria bacterium]|nr:5-(carboxyamino)imidazole ribonucleotide synthase [Candidatus Kapabacteria bacterium]
MLKSIYHQDKTFTLGILGAGQLAKMLASDAYRMGLNVAVIESQTDSPAGDMTKLDFIKGWNNKEELDNFIEISDIITLENEFIDPEILRYIQQKRTVFPSPATMELVQDKFIQKTVFAANGLPVPNFKEINSKDDAVNFAREFGYPYIMKVRKYGYDGYGNATIHNEQDAFAAYDKFHKDKTGKILMAESFVKFTKELAVMIAHNLSGETVMYPTVETIQQNHICHEVIAPANIDETLRIEAQEIALKAVKSIQGIGVFGVEMFLTEQGTILLNEIAPRPHNSGHYSIEACYTSQFENAIRAVCNLPLGSADLISGGACMINLLGERTGSGVPKDINKLLTNKKISLHLYNKKTSRIGRKMGHITAIANSTVEAHDYAKTAAHSIIW